MPSSPEVTAWVPGELSAAVPAPRPGRAFVADPVTTGAVPAPFEMAGAAALPDAVLLPARRAAEAAGYAAGWARGLAAARAAVEEQAARARVELERDRAAARATLESAVLALTDAAEQLARRRAAAVAEAEDSVVAVAFEIIESVVGSVLADDSLRGRAAVARALASRPAGPDAVTVRLHPVDHVAASALDLPCDVTLVADPSLAPGDAVAVTAETTVDASLAAGLDRVREVLGR